MSSFYSFDESITSIALSIASFYDLYESVAAIALSISSLCSMEHQQLVL